MLPNVPIQEVENDCCAAGSIPELAVMPSASVKMEQSKAQPLTARSFLMKNASSPPSRGIKNNNKTTIGLLFPKVGTRLLVENVVGAEVCDATEADASTVARYTSSPLFKNFKKP